MAAKVFTSDELVALVRQYAKLPSAQAAGSQDSDILDFLNTYLSTTLAPALLEMHEDYFARSIRSSLIASTSAYRIHPRSMFLALRDLRYVNSDGLRSPPLEQVSAGHIEYATEGDGTAEVPRRFYLEGNYIHVLPRLGGTVEGKLEQSVVLRPGELVLSENYRKVSSVAGSVVTLDSAPPAGWASGMEFDIHSPDSGAELRCFSKVATISGSDLTFSTAIDGSLSGEYAVQEGDYVGLEETCAVPPIPKDFHRALALAAAADFEDSIGDAQSAERHRKRVGEILRVGFAALRPRVPGKPPLVRLWPYIRAQGGRYA